ncbi:MerR family DNA-binding protein [Cellulomonas sp. ATA003]|uniref:MerR family DNA-binding protein n=1 Tax=Cellulomonas sp. ATA003 TaxID=3073064 RepID=UPI0028739B60|nr:MerR family DNA-binding protein [Cellulomonas sp. ATA003]WNB84769.1 MerR family DNA-binding protein [Cellulomonas sp. ATA003]
MRIGELAAATGTTTKTLRFYDGAGLVHPSARSVAGYRDYDTQAIDRVRFILRGRTAGLTLAQIREILDLRDAGAAPCDHVQRTLDQQLASLEQQIAELTALRETITSLRRRNVQASTCHPETICLYL